MFNTLVPMAPKCVCMHLSIIINLFHYPVHNMPFNVSLLFTHFHSMPSHSFLQTFSTLHFPEFRVCLFLALFSCLLFVSLSAKYMLSRVYCYSSVWLCISFHFAVSPPNGGQRNMHIIYSIHTKRRVRFSRRVDSKKMYRRRQLSQQF